MIEELIKLLKEAYEAGIVTSSIQAKIDSIKKNIKLSDAEYNSIEDRIRIEAYIQKVKGREKKGETFVGDLRKQYKITEEDKDIIREKLNSEYKHAPVILPSKPSLPAKEKEQSMAPITVKTPPSKEIKQDKPVVLVADDNEPFLLLLSTITRNHGYECITTSSPDTAIQTIMEKKPSIVLCDINFGIGKKTGMDVFTTIRKMESTVPFIIISAFIQKEFKKLADKVGITDYITKPIDPDQVLSTIQKYIPH